MKKLTRDDLLNWWLQKYHNTTVKEVVEKHPKEVLNDPSWFELYPVTEKQCEEWADWAGKELRRTKTIIGKDWSFIYLDCAPYVKQEK